MPTRDARVRPSLLAEEPAMDTRSPGATPDAADL